MQSCADKHVMLLPLSFTALYITHYLIILHMSCYYFTLFITFSNCNKTYLHLTGYNECWWFDCTRQSRVLSTQISVYTHSVSQVKIIFSLIIHEKPFPLHILRLIKWYTKASVVYNTTVLVVRGNNNVYSWKWYLAGEVYVVWTKV